MTEKKDDLARLIELVSNLTESVGELTRMRKIHLGVTYRSHGMAEVRAVAEALLKKALEEPEEKKMALLDKETTELLAEMKDRLMQLEDKVALLEEALAPAEEE